MLIICKSNECVTSIDVFEGMRKLFCCPYKCDLPVAFLVALQRPFIRVVSIMFQQQGKNHVKTGLGGHRIGIPGRSS